MAYFARPQQPSLITLLQNIHVDDLQYVEQDLCFHELVSLGFLLFGAEGPNAEFVLQKLLVLANTYKTNVLSSSDLLRKYVSINPDNWRPCLIEALSIIGSRRVLRKLGFKWEELQQHYLPHIAELSLHVHPLLKALYKMCERLSEAQAGQLVLQVNEQRKSPGDLLRFYDFAYLEIFLLDWITHRIMNVGDHTTNNADVEVLLEYFKLNEMDEMKTLLVDTINQNSERQVNSDEATGNSENLKKDKPASKSENREPCTPNFNGNQRVTNSFNESIEPCYLVRRESAGLVLIINQVDFHETEDETLKHLLPKKKLETRLGTDRDRDRLKEVFIQFGYKPEEFRNLNHIDLMHHIREIVKRSFQYDSLIVCVLSHGIDGAVYGSDSVPVKIAAIEHIVTGETLQGKPKFLIIQACQTNLPAVDIHARNANNVTPDSYGDMVKAMSTVPGYTSMRHTIQGSWFIQSLCDAVEQWGDKKHVLDILIEVNRKVSDKRGDQNEMMVPITSNTLRKYFVLPNRT